MTNFTLFISDLHLESKQPEVVELFNDFMTNQACQADALYILGDFFELWVGDDDHSAFNESIKRQLQSVAKKIPVYLMAGNRDFLLGKQFMSQTGCQALMDPQCIQLYGESVILTHGDKLCSDDRLHQWFRYLTGQHWVQKLFQILPLAWRQFIAYRLRGVSKHHHKRLSEASMDAKDRSVQDLLDHYNANKLIHGHTHQPNIHYHTTSRGQASRIVLGAWHDKANILKYYDSGHFELIP